MRLSVAVPLFKAHDDSYETGVRDELSALRAAGGGHVDGAAFTR